MAFPLPKVCLTVVLLGVAIPRGYALDPGTPVNQYGLRHWDNRNGLPQNMVGSMANYNPFTALLGTKRRK